MQTKEEIVSDICVLMKDYELPDGLPLGKDALISGSFLWNVLTRGSWKPRDIDIFCTLDGAMKIRSMLIEAGFKLRSMHEFFYIVGEEEANLIEEWAPPSASECVNTCGPTHHSSAQKFCYDHGLPYLPRDVKFTFSKQKNIQLIYKKGVQDAKELIVGKFDFPTLENYFDGQELVLSPDATQNLFATSIREKYYSTDKEQVTWNICQRVLKYLQYGMSFTSVPPYVENHEQYIAYKYKPVAK